MNTPTPLNSLNGQFKDKHFYNQFLITKEAFFAKPSTMREVEVKTGVLRPNICRFVAMLRDLGQIQVHSKGRCPYTRFIAGFYTTNPDLFEKPVQLDLFEGSAQNGS